jgi:hypothetical protein
MIRNNNGYQSSLVIKSGNTYSYDKVWFVNDTLNQVIVIELYTDLFRTKTYHFYTNNIPDSLISSMWLMKTNDEVATPQQKIKDFDGFVKQANNVNAAYFKSDKGFSLGDPKQKAIKVYGKPSKQELIGDDIERLEWNFEGELYPQNDKLRNRPIVTDSFGYSVTMYFKNGKLIAQIITNDIP